MADTDKLVAEVGEMTLQNGETSLSNPVKDDHSMKWGFPLHELYKIALKFYKEKDGKAIQLSYKEKLRLVAYTKQAAHGKYRNDVSPDVGFLDVVGNDRRLAWQSLGDMSKESAMTEFIKLVDTHCNQFRPFIEANKAEKIEQMKKLKEAEEQRKREEEEKERKRLEEEAQRQLELERKRQMEQELQIRAALNQQTQVQFSQYATQQCPGNKQQQEELIKQLQEQHFQQYMQQVYQQQLLHQQQQYQQLQNMSSNPANNNSTTVVTAKTETKETQQQQQSNGPSSVPTDPDTNGNNQDDLPPLAAASMWTRKDIKEFKESLRKDKDSVIKIGSGETVTVRVPTHEDGSCLFWEFSTDYYDIGFGVYFEWTVEPNSTVTVHVSESSDEEDLDEEQQENKADVEQGSKQDNKPPTDEIIPVYRRDCHEEVYCGSHAYPGQGVYLLKFDNSYSLWRSKTLYYRVYYSR